LSAFALSFHIASLALSIHLYQSCRDSHRKFNEPHCATFGHNVWILVHWLPHSHSTATCLCRPTAVVRNSL